MGRCVEPAVCNPATGRWVGPDSRTGKAIARRAIDGLPPLGGKACKVPARCRHNGRWVNPDGRIGRRLEPGAPPPLRKAPRKEVTIKGLVWTIEGLANLAGMFGRVLRQGAFDTTLMVVVNEPMLTHLRRARGFRLLDKGLHVGDVVRVKVMRPRSDADRAVMTNELKMYRLVADAGTCATLDGERRCTARLVPGLVGSGADGDVGVLVVDDVEGDHLEDHFDRAGVSASLRMLQDAVATLWANGISHNNLRAENMVVVRGKLKILEWGSAFRMRRRPATLKQATDYEGVFAHWVQQTARRRGTAKGDDVSRMKKYSALLSAP